MKFLLAVLTYLACFNCGYASLPNTASSFELSSRSNPDISPRDTPKAKKVFGYYLLSTITEAHAHQDIDNAISMGLDGFALSIGDPSQGFVDESLGYLFGYANFRGFSLYFTLDVYAAGNACNSGITGACGGPSAYHEILQDNLGQSSYYLGPNGLPMISTYSSGGLTHDDWASWKSSFANQMYFIPDFDETEGYYSATDGWYSYWGDILEGLFSWEAAWPLYNGFGGNYPGDISPDLPVLAGATAHGKGYMMSLSALQYKDAFDTNIYRAGELNLPTRMSNILSMTESPDFIQIITWNDGPESNYFGNIWPEQNGDINAAKYANDEWDHSGWQSLITSFMQAWKAGSPASAMQPPSDQPIGALWYKTILQDATCPANSSSDEAQYSTKPTGFDAGVNQLNYAIVVEPGATEYTLQAYTNGIALESVNLNPGLNYGAFTGAQAGLQMLQIISAGNVVMVATGGRCISPGCPDCIYNMNYQVIGFVESAATSASGTCPYVCPLPQISNKGVFAHYLVGVTTQAHVQQDIDEAVAMGFSAFALNVADPTLSFVTDTFNYMFNYVLATYPNFKLFLSMDVKVMNNLGNYQTLLSNFMENDAYLQAPDGGAFLSTFTSGGLQNTDWSSFLNGLAELPYFVPDFDDAAGYYTSDPGFWSYWGGLLQGTFSWEAAWPQEGISATTDDISLDQAAINGAVAHGKTYMIALSPLQYKNAYGSNYYREGSLNLPQRIEAILNLSPAPDFAEFITWNDGPESQYIGNLWPEQNTDVQPAFYANALASHNGWRPLITSFIMAFQTESSPSEMVPPTGSIAIGSLWYNSILQTSVCTSNGTQYTSPPDGFTTATDQLNWAIVVAANQTGLNLHAISNGFLLNTVFSLSPGLNYGAFTGISAGFQRLELRSTGGEVLLAATGGRCISGGCPDCIYNLNPVVVPLAEDNDDVGPCPSLYCGVSSASSVLSSIVSSTSSSVSSNFATSPAFSSSSSAVPSSSSIFQVLSSPSSSTLIPSSTSSPQAGSTFTGATSSSSLVSSTLSSAAPSSSSSITTLSMLSASQAQTSSSSTGYTYSALISISQTQAASSTTLRPSSSSFDTTNTFIFISQPTTTPAPSAFTCLASSDPSITNAAECSSAASARIFDGGCPCFYSSSG